MTTQNKKSLIPLKYLGLMMSLFLIEHLYLSEVYARLVDICYSHQEDMCHNEIGLCAQNVRQPF